MSKNKKILIGIIVFIALILAFGSFFVGLKLSKVNFQEIDKSDLDINEDIYEEVAQVSTDITKNEFNSVKTLVFFGTDSRDTQNMSAGRSDTIIVVSINPKNNSIKLISIPRDTYVLVPGHGNTKINHAYAYGGEQLSIKTINNNFSLAITEYVTIDFAGLVNVIDTVGGINVNITEEEKNYINRSSTLKLTSSGNVLLNGEQALVHSRNRTVGNDFVRASRQRTILEALILKITAMDINNIMKLSDSILKEVKTNINIVEYTSLLKNVLSNKSDYTNNIVSIQLPAAEYSSGKMINGVYYFVTDIEKTKTDFYKYIYE